MIDGPLKKKAQALAKKLGHRLKWKTHTVCCQRCQATIPLGENILADLKETTCTSKAE